MSLHAFELSKLEDPGWSSLRRLLWFAFSVVNERTLEVLRERGHTDIRLSVATGLRVMDLEGTRIGTMAERAGVTKQAMGQVVAELQAQGWVEVQKDAADERAKKVTYTEAGRQIVQAFIEADRQVLADLKAALGSEEVDLLTDMLKWLLQAEFSNKK